jgi:hypothetical protein
MKRFSLPPPSSSSSSSSSREESQIQQKENSFETRDVDEFTFCQINGINLVGIFRYWVLEFKFIISFIIKFFLVLWDLWLWILTFFNIYFLWFLFFLFLFYLSHIFWPFFIDLVILVFIPILNLAIIAFNFISFFVIFILRILFFIWNIIVPFLGFLLYFIFDIVFTILQQVFDALGSINFEPIMTSLMNILFILSDILCQILTVLVKVGIPILIDLAKIVSTLLEVIFTVIKVLLPIVVWIVKILFVVLEPILKIIAVFFGGLASAFGSLKTGRKLLWEEGEETSKEEKFVNPFDFSVTSQKPEWLEFVMKTLPLDENLQPSLYTSTAAFHYSTNITSLGRKLLSRPPDIQSFSKRKRSPGLEFLDEEEVIDEEADQPKNVKDDDLSFIMAHTMYQSAKGMDGVVLKQGSEYLKEILDHHQRVDPLAIDRILQRHYQEHGHLKASHDQRAGSLNYGVEPMHPQHLERKLRAERHQIFSSGRQLLGLPHQWNDQHIDVARSQLEQEHAREVVKQYNLYNEHVMGRMQIATIMENAVTTTIRKHAETTLHPQNLMEQWSVALQQMGYTDIWDIRDQFLQKHGDFANFLMSFGSMTELPVFKYFKAQDPNQDESPYFHDWLVEQQKMAQEREERESLNTGRQLLQTDNLQDNRPPGAGTSKTALSGFEIISKKNCFSSPKHPLCLPIIPPDFKITIPTIDLTEEQKAKLRTDVATCKPWKDEVYCLICLERLYNVWISFRFILSAIPPINFAVAALTTRIPWMGWFLDWIFIVPKFHVANFTQWLCFCYHLWDVVIVSILGYLAFKILFAFLPLFYDSFLEALDTFQPTEIKPDPHIAALDSYFKGIINHPVTMDEAEGKFVMGKIHHIHQHHHHLHHQTMVFPQITTPFDQMSLEELIQLLRILKPHSNEESMVLARIKAFLNHTHERFIDLSGDIDYQHAQYAQQGLENHPLIKNKHQWITHQPSGSQQDP